MAYEVAAEQPEGLRDGETAVLLDSNILIAVKVTPEYLPQGQGVAVHAEARWIEADGTSKEANGVEVTSGLDSTFDNHFLTTYGLNALTKEVLLTVLGEPHELTREVPVGGQQFAEGQDIHSVETTDNVTSEVPVVQIPETHKACADIKCSIECATAIHALPDVAGILGG